MQFNSPNIREITGEWYAKSALVKALGADHVIDYTKETSLKTADHDVIFDVLGKSSFSRCQNSLTETEFIS